MIGDLVPELAGLIVGVSNNAPVFVEICTGNKTGPAGRQSSKDLATEKACNVTENPTLIKHSPPLLSISISLGFFVLNLTVSPPSLAVILKYLFLLTRPCLCLFICLLCPPRQTSLPVFVVGSLRPRYTSNFVWGQKEV